MTSAQITGKLDGLALLDHFSVEEANAMKYIPDIYLGLPSFGARIRTNYEYPGGQFGISLKILEQIDGDIERAREIIYFEYCTIAATLMRMGEDFSIIRAYVKPDWADMLGRFEQAGFEFVDFPEINQVKLLYPRDLAVCLPDGNTLVCYNKPYNFDKLATEKIKVMVSHLGEGGRTSIGGGKAIYPENVAEERNPKQKDGFYQIVRPDCRSIRVSGIRPVALPTPVTLQVRSKAANFGNHLDLFMGLITDRSGGSHLIIDPKIQAWIRNISGFMTNKETLEIYRRICGENEIQIHVPTSPLNIPASLCFYQSPSSGRVLMTSGEDEVAEIVAGIIGEDQIWTTSAPIRYYPVLNQAGIHCLIGELPPWMRQMSQYVNLEATCPA